jgi:hypothetical protein
MTAIERLRDALKVGGKTRGLRDPIYRPDGTLDHYAKEMIEVQAGDIAEACAAAADQTDKVVIALAKGTKVHHPELKVTIYADDLFQILDGKQ